MVGAIRGDEVEVRPGEFVGAVTVLMRRGMVRMVGSRVVTATASQPDVWSTVELAGRSAFMGRCTGAKPGGSAGFQTHPEVQPR